MTDDKSSFLDLLREDADGKTQNLQAFKKEGSGITPLVQDTVDKISVPLDRETARIRQLAATRQPEAESDQASSAFVAMVGPNDVLEFRRPGIQPRVLARLRAGEYHEADYLDLHGKTIDQAYERVMSFLTFAKEEELRCVLIIHGKGEQRREKAVMKSYVAHWLRQIPEVLAFHSAPQWKGGTGAVMVILKKGEKARACNRELHARR